MAAVLTEFSQFDQIGMSQASQNAKLVNEIGLAAAVEAFQGNAFIGPEIARPVNDAAPASPEFGF